MPTADFNEAVQGVREIKELVENSKMRFAKRQGKLSQIMEQMEKEFEVTSIKEADDKRASMKTTLTEKTRTLIELHSKLRNKMEEGVEDIERAKSNDL